MRSKVRYNLQILHDLRICSGRSCSFPPSWSRGKWVQRCGRLLEIIRKEGYSASWDSALRVFLVADAGIDGRVRTELRLFSHASWEHSLTKPIHHQFTTLFTQKNVSYPFENILKTSQCFAVILPFNLDLASFLPLTAY